MNEQRTDVIAKLAENYRNIEKILIEELKIDENNSSGMTSAEEIWQPLFKRIVPTKYNVEKNVYIIDSNKGVSKKVSIVIYDEQYTPYIFNYNTIKYIPIEAVFAVVLCDNQFSRKLEVEHHEEETWLQSIQKLRTDLNAYVRIQPGLLDTNLTLLHKEWEEDSKKTQTQTSTRPITILCTTMKDKYPEKDKFDIILSVLDSEIKKEIPKEEQSLDDWYEQLNHYGLERYGEENEIKLKELSKLKNGEKTTRTLTELRVEKVERKEENILLSLMFQLNQLLMIINNPIYFPHQSYIKVFSNGADKK